MADTVQHFLECMLPELQYFLEHGIFSAPELRQIVAKRKRFEYKLKSKGAGLEHFLRYIDYEMSLDKLRLLRLELAGIKDVDKMKMHAGLSRIHAIYSRALRRFYHMEHLWLNYVAFCFSSRKKRSNGYGTALSKLTRVFSRAIQYHPQCEELWIRFALWEYEMNHNVLAARATLQKGLRMNPKSWWMWSEYFSLELQYMHRLQERMRIVGIDPKNIADEVKKEEEDEKARQEAEKQAEIDYDELPSSPEREDESDDERGASTPLAAHFSCATDAVIYGEIPRLVFASATQSAPKELKWYIECYEKLSAYQDTELVRQEILASIKRDFPEDPQAIRFVVCTTSDDVAGILAELIKRASDAGTAGMWEMAIDFVSECLEKGTVDPHSLQLRDNSLPLPAAHLESLFEQAHEGGVHSVRLFALWTRVLLGLGRIHRCREVAALCTDAAPHSPAAWELRARVLLRVGLRTGEHVESEVAAMLRAAIAKVPTEDSASLYSLLFQVLLQSGISFSQLSSSLDDLFSASHILVLSSDQGLYEGIISAVNAVFGISCARTLYKKVMRVHDASEAVFEMCARLEMAHLSSAPSSASISTVRELFERALRDSSPLASVSTSLWLSYATLEYEYGHFDKAHAVHWRALKNLKSPRTFQAAFQDLIA